MKVGALRAARQQQFAATTLYPVVTGEFCAGRSSLEVLDALLAGGAKIVQLREKNLAGKERLTLAHAYRRKTLAADALLIINDQVELGLEVGADGVHLGQGDMTLQQARSLGPDLLLGQSTHSLSQALLGDNQDADYINYGPIFPTRTKTTTCPALGSELIPELARQLKRPFSIMGGIKAQHLPELIRLGARHIAMVTELTQAPDVALRFRQLAEICSFHFSHS
jgi:thiamine-phosphate pyrophosphorylase